MRSSQIESPLENSPENSSQEKIVRSIRLLFWAFVFVVGLIQFWAHRNDMNPDGTSYIEIGQTSIREGWHALVNGYWSPLYPFLISVVLRIFRPSPEWEFTAVHGLNFGVYLASFACFQIFLRELLGDKQAEGTSRSDLSSLPQGMVWSWGCALFLWTAHYWLGIGMVSPDLCVAALVYLATAVLLRIRRKDSGLGSFLALGVVLGLGYLAKAAMFPLGLVFLGCAFFLEMIARSSRWQAVVRTLVAFVAFVAVAGPFVLALSHAKGRITFGDSGKINYAEYVDRAPLIAHWQGDPPGTGVPLHPTRKIMSDPPMYGFAEPVAGSYPPWYDPSYWYAGITAHFSVKQQAWVLFRAANAYLKMFSRSGALYAVFLALFWFSRKGGVWESAVKETWLVFLPSFAALGLYSLVLVESRYVISFVLGLVLWIFSRLRMRTGADTKSLRRMNAVILGAPLLALVWPIVSDAVAIRKPRPFESYEVMRGLREAGVLNGARVGFVGRGNQSYWAHLAGVKIVAEIPEQGREEFLSSDAAKKREIMEKFQQAGTTVVVMKDTTGSVSMDGWRQIGGTPYYLYYFLEPGQRRSLPVL